MPGFVLRRALRVVHEDEAVIVVDKPAGLLTAAPRESREESVLKALTLRSRKARGKPNSKTKTQKLWVVHRLDREASGLLVFAKSESALNWLKEDFRARRVHRLYLAVTEGRLGETGQAGSIQVPLVEDHLGRVRVAASGPVGRRVQSGGVPGPTDARAAVTHFRIVHAGEHYCLVQVRLETGRKHQIRVHMQSRSCPLAGDARYGAVTNPLERLGLHAAELGFTHPTTGETLRFTSAAPAKFYQVCGLAAPAAVVGADGGAAVRAKGSAPRGPSSEVDKGGKAWGAGGGSEVSEAGGGVSGESGVGTAPDAGSTTAGSAGRRVEAKPVRVRSAALPASVAGERGMAGEVKPETERGLSESEEGRRESGVEPAGGAASRKTSAEGVDTSWESVAGWYDALLDERGSDHYRDVILPGALRLLRAKAGERVLDVACGQGVLCRLLAEAGVKVTGVDASAALIERARARTGQRKGDERGEAVYVVGDARALEGHGFSGFDGAACVMALSNIDPLSPVIRGVSGALRAGGVFVFIIVHPAFRAAGQTGWGWDGASGRQYRRVDGYLSAGATPIRMHPGSDPGVVTWTFHRPLQTYVRTLAEHGLLIDTLEEWPGRRVSTSGPRAAEENRARREIPLFLGLRAVKAE